MNTVKIMNDLVKAAVKNRLSQYRYGEDSDHIYIMKNNIQLFRIKKDEFFLDIKKIFGNREPLTNCKRFFSTDNIRNIVKTDDIRTFHNDLLLGNDSIVKLEDESGTLVKWVNMKLLKEFDKFCTFKSKCDYYAGVQIFEGDEAVGLILPVNVKEGD